MYKRNAFIACILILCLCVIPMPVAAADFQPLCEEANWPIPESNCGVPLYFQEDYPDVPYGDGTMATSGCGPTSLAMVATYLTGYTYTPDMIADYFASLENNVQRMDLGSDGLKLPWRRAADINEAIEALKEGDVVIGFVGPASLFTSTQHFIVLAGINEDGLIMVNDPMKEHYYQPRLARMLRVGFTRGELVNGFGGGWIYDVSAMEEPEYQHTPYIKPRYPHISLSQQDKDLIATVMMLEAGDKSEKCQQAIAEVLLNRMWNWGFSDYLPGVLYSENRSSGPLYRSRLPELQPEQTQYDILERAFSGPYVLERDVVYFGDYPKDTPIWGEIDGIIFCHYF